MGRVREVLVDTKDEGQCGDKKVAGAGRQGATGAQKRREEDPPSDQALVEG